jgi:hypothetical protein
MSKYSEDQRASSLANLKTKLATHIEKAATKNDLSLSDTTKDVIIDETTSLTHSPSRAALMISRLLGTQERFPSLHEPELIKERLAYAYQLSMPSEPDFRVKADKHASKVLNEAAGNSPGYER